MSSSSPSPAALTRSPALAWLMARAYASNRFMACLSIPLAMMIVLCYGIRRQVYESSDGHGMVIIGPYRYGRDAVIFVALVLPTGPETPEGDRWHIAGLAQRPGTRLSGLPLALRLRDSAPAGTVVVAAAVNDRLLEGYKGLNFTEGKERRVYWVADDNESV